MKCYVGSSNNIKKRWKSHLVSLNKNSHYNKYLQAAWNKHWSINFEFKFIEIVCSKELAAREQYWMDKLKAYDKNHGYNARPTSNNNTGYVWSAEQLKNLSEAKKGYKHSEEAKEKMRFKKPAMSERMKGNKFRQGYKYSEEDKIRIANQPRKLDKWPCKLGSRCKCENCKEKMREYHRNRRKVFKNAK